MIPAINLQQFQSYPDTIQRKLVHRRGVFLLSRKGEEDVVNLYRVDGFYVELFFNQRMSAVLRIGAFEDTAGLDAYLQQVELPGIKQLLP
jgi:hypothetical protein